MSGASPGDAASSSKGRRQIRRPAKYEKLKRGCFGAEDGRRAPASAASANAANIRSVGSSGDPTMRRFQRPRARQCHDGAGGPARDLGGYLSRVRGRLARTDGCPHRRTRASTVAAVRLIAARRERKAPIAGMLLATEALGIAAGKRRPAWGCGSSSGAASENKTRIERPANEGASSAGPSGAQGGILMSTSRSCRLIALARLPRRSARDIGRTASPVWPQRRAGRLRLAPARSGAPAAQAFARSSSPWPAAR